MKNYYIECTNLFKIYKASDLEVVALRGLELSVDKGEIISIVGSSGSGKSTLLNILAGYDFPSAGIVKVGNYDLLQMSKEEIVRYRRKEVGFIWQDTNKNLFNYLSAIENIKLPMVITGKNKNIINDRADELIELVGLSNRKNHMPYELSGGEQQRIAIAVALSNNPPLILADEPTGELDDETSQNILDLLNKLNQKLNTTIVIVTHDPKISNDVSRSITIKDGKTSLETQIINNEKNEYLLIDSIGSLQIPKKILDSNNIDKRVKIYNEGGVIKIEADNEK
tara:strand:- start:5927 stop:6772 length:846 start_codon:yes stop_codon:yes gene_type:complete